MPGSFGGWGLTGWVWGCSPIKKGTDQNGPDQEELGADSEGAQTWEPTPCPHSPPGGHRPPKAAPRSHWYGLVPQWRGQGALQLVLKGREVGRKTSQSLTDCAEYTKILVTATQEPRAHPGFHSPNSIPEASTYPGSPHLHCPPVRAGLDALADSGRSGVSWGE